MKKRIEQLINGNFEYNVPNIILSQDCIQVTTVAGVNYRGELHIGTSDNTAIKGILLSSDRRLVLGKNHFSGNAVHVPYGFEVTGLKVGDSCEGTLTISTNIGERSIPFMLAIQEESITTTSGMVSDLEGFAKLAQIDYREAFLLFTSAEFKHLMEKEGTKYDSLYGAMSKNPVTYQHLEEFLIGIEQKKRVKLSLGEEQREFYAVTESAKNELLIHKDNWGYVRIEVEVQGEFIEVEKRVINQDDFIGSVYPLEYIIRKERLGHGHKYGRIILRTVYQTLSYEVEASLDQPIKINFGRIDKKNQLTFSKDYMAFILKRMSQEEWVRRTLELLEEMKQSGHFYDIHQLYEAYVYYVSDEIEKAKELLEQFSSREFQKGERELAGFYLYLGKITGFIKEETIHVHQEIIELYKVQRESFCLLWLLLQLDEKLNRSPLKKMYMLERQYELGCSSPFLYLEAYGCISQDITVLRNLDTFQQQTLLFANRIGILSEEVATRVAYLSSYEKEFHESIYKILGFAYKKYPSNEILEAICKLIMKGNPGKNTYFKWYEEAIEKDLHLTRLYEYYVETMEENYQKLLPQSIRLYFLYNNNLSDKKKAYVYANIIINKSIDRETYEHYERTIERFAYRKLQEGRFNQNYAVIYQEFIRNIQERNIAEAMSRVLFSYKLCCDDRKVRNVIVHHAEFKQEMSFPCIDGVAYITIYTKDAKIVFQDEKQRRYGNTVGYSIQKLMEEEHILGQCEKLGIKDPGFLLHMCKTVYHMEQIDHENIKTFQRVLKSNVFKEEYKEQLRQSLLNYYRVNIQDESIESFVESLDYKNLGTLDKSLYMEVLIECGNYKKAFDMICEYGYEHVALSKLVKLCSRMIMQMEFQEEEELVYLAAFVLRHEKYDEIILQYLIKYYLGTLEELEKVWICAKGFTMDAYELEERILIYAMYVREFPQDGPSILRSYMQHGGKEQISKAYLTYEAYGIFMENKEPDPFIFKCLEKVFTKKIEVDLICHIALLKVYTVCEELTKIQERNISRLLDEFNQKGLRLGFFQKLPKEYLQPYQLDDKIFVEYKTSPKDRVVLYYALHDGGVEATQFRYEPLKNIYQGIFSKEFILFYGEELTYYFQIEREEEKIVTKRKTVTLNDVVMEGNTKYEILNQLLAANHLGQMEVFDEKMQQYLFYERLTNKTEFGGDDYE